MAGRGDFNLLSFDNYSDYLQSFTKVEDYRYLSSMKVIKSFVKLGYCSNAVIYKEDEFYKAKKQLQELINPKSIISKLYGQYLVGDDPALIAFKEREERNVQKKLSTIIFLQIRKRSGFDISGYIDYADSLMGFTVNRHGATNWKAVFEGRAMLRPNRHDLSFYDWESGNILFNNSDNFEVIHLGTSLMFKHYGDHKIISVNPSDYSNNDSVKRTFLNSPLYGYLVFYDHIVRKPS